MPVQRTLRVILEIPAEDIQQYYEGAARNVVAVARDGRSVKFPANILRSVVSHDGVHGEFELSFDENNKFLAIRRIGD